MSVTTRHVAFRFKTEDLAAIDEQAAAHGLNRTSFLVKSALGQLGSVGLDGRVDKLEQRIKHLERLAQLSDR